MKESEESELKKILHDGYEQGCWVNLDILRKEIIDLAIKKINECDKDSEDVIYTHEAKQRLEEM